jgi:hypothetical protein
MATNIKYFLGTLNVTIGEYQNNVRLLLAANSEAQADDLLAHAAASYYGNGDEELEDGGYYANHGEVHTKPASLVEIGAATFYELRSVLSTRIAGNVVLQDLDAATEPGFKAFAKAVVNALRARRIEVRQTNMLEVLASAFGQKNWNVLQAKFQAPAKPEVATPVSSEQDGPVDRDRKALVALFLALEAGQVPVIFDGKPWKVVYHSLDALDTEQPDLALELEPCWDGANDTVLFHGDQFTGSRVAELEEHVDLILADGSRLGFVLPEQEWTANVCRTGYGFSNVTVRARTQAEAEDKALDEAGDHQFNEKASEYEVDWVYPAK